MSISDDFIYAPKRTIASSSDPMYQYRGEFRDYINDVTDELRSAVSKVPYVMNQPYGQRARLSRPHKSPTGVIVQFDVALEDEGLDAKLTLAHADTEPLHLRSRRDYPGIWFPENSGSRSRPTSDIIAHLAAHEIIGSDSDTDSILDSATEPTPEQTYRVFERLARSIGNGAYIQTEYDFSQHELHSAGPGTDMFWERVIRLGSVTRLAGSDELEYSHQKEADYMKVTAPFDLNGDRIEATHFILARPHQTDIGMVLRGNNNHVPLYAEAINKELVMANISTEITAINAMIAHLAKYD